MDRESYDCSISCWNANKQKWYENGLMYYTDPKIAKDLKDELRQQWETVVPQHRPRCGVVMPSGKFCIELMYLCDSGFPNYNVDELDRTGACHQHIIENRTIQLPPIPSGMSRLCVRESDFYYDSTGKYKPKYNIIDLQ